MARAPGSDASQRLAAAAGAVTPMSGSRTNPGSIARSPSSDFKALPLLARRMHLLAVVLAVASSAASCVVPPPLQLDEPDAGANSPPTIISIRGDNAVEYQEQGVVALIRGQGSFTATLYDTDLDDTLYVRVFVNWTPENTVAANAACSATPLPTPSATRTATCDLAGVCLPGAGANDQMIVEVYDREPLDTGQPLHRVTEGLRTNRTFTLSCSEPPQ
jgi:hypothetical protein